MKNFLISLLIFLSLPAGVASAAPKAELWPVWQAHDPASVQALDHQAWQDFLDTYLVQSPDGINRLPYGRVSLLDKKRLAAYLRRLSQVLVFGLNRSRQQAFWINLYNALTVKVILDHYPVKSIFDINISPGWFARGPWAKKLIKVEGRKLSLDDIEHRILRPIWKDPRVHYSLNCASLGCPNLSSEAFTKGNLERLLEEGARDYINHLRGVHFAGEKLVVSSIFKWFASDFGADSKALVTHLKKYSEANLRKRLQAVTKISAYEYDWRLNDVEIE